MLYHLQSESGMIHENPRFWGLPLESAGIFHEWGLSSKFNLNHSDYCSHQAMIDVNTVERLIPDTGWWFQPFFILHHIWDNPSHWLSYFSRRLKPPSSDKSGWKDQDFYVGTVSIFRWIFHCLILHTSSRLAVTFFLDETKWSQGQMGPIMKIGGRFIFLHQWEYNWEFIMFICWMIMGYIHIYI